MSYFAYAAGIRRTGLMLLLLVCGMVPPIFAQNRALQRSVRIGVDGYPYLGIQMEDVTADNMAKYKMTVEHGVIVRSVEKGSPAEAAKLREDDVILQYAGMPVFSAGQFARMVQETPVGRKVEIVVSRDGNRVSLAAEIGKREGPPSFDRGMNVFPWGQEGRGFEFFGPNDRFFQFRAPEGRGFMYNIPGTGDRFFSLQRPRMGVTLEPLTDQMAEFLGVPGKKGLLVTSVDKDSAAASKLKAGDVIVQADGKVLARPDDLARLLESKENGTVDLKIVRDKKEISVSVTLPKDDQSKDRRGYRL